MTTAELLHKRILILESRALKLAKAETSADRSRYRRLHTLCQRVSERNAQIYGRLLELIRPQIEALVAKEIDRTQGDADWAKRRLRGSFNWDDSLDDVIITEAICEISRRQQQAKERYVPRAKA